MYQSACGFGQIWFAAIISQTETISFAYGLHLPGSELQVLAAASLPPSPPPSRSPLPMKSISKKSIALPFPPCRRETSQLCADEPSAVVTALTWGPFVTQFQPENKALYSGTSLPLALPLRLTVRVMAFWLPRALSASLSHFLSVPFTAPSPPPPQLQSDSVLFTTGFGGSVLLCARIEDKLYSVC